MERVKTEKAHAKTSRASQSKECTKQDADKCYEEMRDRLGLVPQFARLIPETSVVGAWEEWKRIYLNTDTALQIKTKDLIAVALNAHSSSRLSGQFCKEMAKVNGVSQQEFQEAVSIAGVATHWSVYLQGVLESERHYKQEVDQVIRYARDCREQVAHKSPSTEMSEEDFMVHLETVEETYNDMDRVLGSIPTFLRKFPMEGISGAWMELKNIQYNPMTAIGLKEKQLIGLAVSAQIPCRYTIYLHREVARLHGATEREIDETLAVAGMIRHWNTVINGSDLDENSFRNELQQMSQALSKQKAA